MGPGPRRGNLDCLHSDWPRDPPCQRLSGHSRLPAQAARDNTGAHARAAANRAAETGERRQCRADSAARYTSTWTHWPPIVVPTTDWRADRGLRLAMVVAARPVPGHGAAPRTGGESRTAPRRRAQCSGSGRQPCGLAPRVYGRVTTGRRGRIPVHADRPRRPNLRRESKRGHIARSARRSGCGRGTALSTARLGWSDAIAPRMMMLVARTRLTRGALMPPPHCSLNEPPRAA